MESRRVTPAGWSKMERRGRSRKKEWGGPKMEGWWLGEDGKGCRPKTENGGVIEDVG